MRISDWSSDVCSSDLPPPLCRSRESGGNFATRGLHDRRTAARGVCLSEESWLSGRKRRTRNAKCRQRYRGFESLTDRKSVVWGKSVSVRVDLGGRRIIKKKNKNLTVM